MARPVIFEYDPATGQELAAELPDDLFPISSLADIAEEVPSGAGASVVAEASTVSTSSLGSFTAGNSSSSAASAATKKVACHKPQAPRLNEAGKAKVKRAVKHARSLDDLTEIERALDSGQISEGLAARLHLGPGDFQQEEATSESARMEPAPTAPLGAKVLTPFGLLKVRKFIEEATDLEKLAEVDRALNAGDIYRLRVMLNLEAQDIIQQPPAELSIPAPLEEDDDYDPFATEPTRAEPATAEPAREEQVAKKKTAAKSAGKKAKKAKKPKEQQDGALKNLQSAYSASSSEERDVPGSQGKPPKKRRKQNQKEAKEPQTQQPQTLAWPMAWTWLMSRTQQHPDFRPPPLSTDTKWAEDAPANLPSGDEEEPPLIVSIATSLVYVGDASGYYPRHLGRVAVVDEKGKVLLDVHIRPCAKLLDCRTHLTGIQKEALEEGAGALDFEEARARLLGLLRPRTILVGHRVCTDLEALRLWHGPLVDVALLFPVDSRKRFQYHPLQYIGERVLLIAAPPEGAEPQPHDAVEVARLAMRLASHESAQPAPTAPFPPRDGSGRELVVRHIPGSWGKFAAERIAELLPGVGKVTVRWLLSETDPTDWRGEAVILFRDEQSRDEVFMRAKGLTDVHVAWEDAPDAPPLGAFLTEQALIEAFSSFGMVVCARIPRKPTTQEPQSFAFISFLDAEDAQRVGRKTGVEVPITPTWNLELKPRVAKFGNSNDKRVAVKEGSGDEMDVGFDWVHLCKR
eukprot:TRINITY_DN93224_c0_g1_i1.p1 TRINITY_DN93224_c0_g1~~TRINITY_DN93224_c0_g1_i1.p1  ORF type:complete len:756 (-),score=149.56 TRINITY_DN93224_c0_g1_i1:97-2331(-)